MGGREGEKTCPCHLGEEQERWGWQDNPSLFVQAVTGLREEREREEIKFYASQGQIFFMTR